MTKYRRADPRAAALALREAAERYLGATETAVAPTDDADADLRLLALAEADSAGHPLLPGDVADRLFAGDNAVKALREWRGLTQAELAAIVDISQAFLSEIESGGKSAAATIYRRIASVLGVSIDLLLPDEEMPIYKLTPRLRDDPDWRTSSYRGPVIVRAPSEKAARWAASLAFDAPTRRKLGGASRSPWRRADTVTAKPVKTTRWPATGGVEILDPFGHGAGR